MPVTARRLSLLRAVSQTSELCIRPTGRTLAKHRKPTKSKAPKAAATVLSVGLAVGGGAAITVSAPPATASAATTSATAARGSQSIASRPLLRYGDRGPTVRYVQKVLHVTPRTGFYGKITTARVKAYQRSWGLKVTGTTTRETWSRLIWSAQHHHLWGPRVASTASNSTFRARVLREAAKLKGTPYRYGGTTTRGFDCSGYTGYVYKKAGKKLPRTSRQQYKAVKHISRKAAKPGDLVFFKSGGGGVYHVGIYAGGNTLWHASRPGRPVAKAKIWTKSVAFGRV
ncbi:cell wall-associated NlpC family hydrolase [Kribbella antiqua]|uniref:Cell wall-associated NlpC family hydrolase n=1 Tax=Kribbella antiqua TaxID=2512217 RepID=A0A4R2IX56_9ACTN|nr:NlpC/P60 family protein [Kribbella antiqua]TCO47525.1 cell wall-associated NlpC family hydrolase [Kribbella antiqua]